MGDGAAIDFHPRTQGTLGNFGGDSELDPSYWIP